MRSPKSKKVLAIIPARGGSKGIPKKNIFPVNGRPLIAFTIEAALKSKHITDTYVTSDSDEILKVAFKCGAKIIKRPSVLAKDTSSSESVLDHAIHYLVSQKKKYDIIVLLQPTSPLRDSKDIDVALKLFFSSNATSLISVFEPVYSPFKSFVLNKAGFLKGLVNNKTPFIRRQDLPIAYFPNGAIYITLVNSFLQSGSLFSNKTIPYIMSKDKSIDIDTIEDINSIFILK